VNDTALDWVIENGTIITMDGDLHIIEDGVIGVSGEKITRLGPKAQGAIDARQRLDARGGLILPGLVNAHTHAAMTLFRGIADDLPLMQWLENYIFPVEQRMDRRFIQSGTQLACAEMIASGTTCFCDMYLFEHEVAKAAKAAGMRCLVGEVLYDFPSPNYGPIEKGLAYTETLIREWRQDPLVSVAIEPHSPYTCSPQLLSQTQALAERYDVPLIMHLAESDHENEQILGRYGKRPVAHIDDLGLLSPKLIADHCVHLSETEMDLLAERGVSVVHNPESNMKLGSGVAPVVDLIVRGVRVGLGTDGCAANNNLDLFTEMDSAAKLAKVHRLDPTALDAVTVLRMATIDGARALGMDRIIGSIEIGKKADIIVVNTDRPHLTPLYNPYSQLVYAATGADVRHTMVNGVVLMRDRHLQTLDLEGVMSEARVQAKRVMAWVNK
jgi:5-methylthioadenosine/S-adenosylhomocysteine deaminase